MAEVEAQTVIDRLAGEVARLTVRAVVAEERAAQAEEQADE